MAKLASTFIIGLLLLGQSATAQEAKTFTPEELKTRTVERRAIDALIWGVPTVSLDMMRQAYFRDGKAEYNDIIWWPKGATWKNQSMAANTIVRYIYFFSNTKKSGPVVFELPPAVGGAAGFYGTIMDAWQVPLTDVGVGGKGGKYLLLPPDYNGEVPSDYTPIRLKTYNSYALVRSILGSNSEEDVRKGDVLVKKIKVYPLSEVAHPPQQRFIDMTGVLYEPAVPYNVDFYVSLARMINEEPAQTKDMEMLGMLLPLGIEKGKTFDPDSATRTVLNASASEAQAWLLDGIARVAVLWWPGEHWIIPTAPVGLKTTFLWQVPEFFDVDGRGITLADWFGRVSANVPVKEFWSITAYDMTTSGLFRDSERLVVSSTDEGVQKNPDGSVDVYFGPKAPAGKEANWVYTLEGKNWFPWFRFYGPERAVEDKSWKMPDIEKVN